MKNSTTKQSNRIKKHSFKLLFFFTVLTNLFYSGSFAQNGSNFNDGYITVFNVTSGAALVNTGTAISIEEYNPTTATQSSANYSVSVPTTGATKLVASGTATSAGAMTRSENGRYLIVPGYQNNVGDANTLFTTTGSCRTISGAGVYGAGASGNGSVLWFSASNNLRGGTSDDGTNFWMSGGSTGIEYTSSGNANAVTVVSTTSTNTRVVNIFNGQLYFATGSGSQGIYSVGSGEPTGTGTVSTRLFAPVVTSEYGFSISPDGNTLYFVNDASATGVYRATFNGSTWTTGTQIFSGTGYTGIAVNWSGYTFSATGANGAIIYASNPSTIITGNDNGTGLLSTTTIRTDIANSAFRQIALSPIKQSVSKGTNTPATGNIAIGGSNTTLFQFNLSADEGNSTIKSAVVHQNGTASIGTGNNISNFRLVIDANNNGIAEAGELSAGTTVTGTVSGSDITFSSINIGSYILQGSSMNFIVVGDVSSGATAGSTFIPTVVSNKTLNSVNYTNNIKNAGSTYVTIGATPPTGNTLTLANLPAITINTTGFNGAFGSIAMGSSSASSSFTVSGSNLTNDIIITPPSGSFQIRTGANSFSTSPITLTQSGGSVGLTTIDVLFAPAGLGTQSGNITLTSTGATTQTIAVSGTGIAPLPATKLAITSISPASPIQNSTFSVTVQAQDVSNNPENVGSNENFTLSVHTGTGSISGTVTGTITAGTSSVTVTGVIYNVGETGVSLTATETSGNLLATGTSSTFTVIAIANHLAFVGVPSTGNTGINITSFNVQARRPDNTVDINYTAAVTVSKLTGPGNLVGTTSVPAVSGVAIFNNLQFDAPGTYTLTTSSGTLTTATTGNIVVTTLPTMTEVIFPQYAVNGNTTADRLQYVCRMALGNLTPNATYRYTTSGNTAGNMFVINNTADADGYIVGYSSGKALSGSLMGGDEFTSSSRYGQFTTDATGNYTGWFTMVPTSNAQFAAGSLVTFNVQLNNGAGGTSQAFQLSSTHTITMIASTSGANGGQAVYGNSNATSENMIFLYDNTAGTGRPLYGTWSEDDNIFTNFTDWYAANIDGVPGAWGAYVPVALPNGIRRIEQRSTATGNIFGCPATSSNGVWTDAGNTVNPAGGTATPIVFSINDAPLGQKTITASTNSGGAITPSGVTGVDCGGSQAYTITPSSCFHIADVLIDGASQGAISSYTFSNVQANHTINVNFAASTPPSAVISSSNGLNLTCITTSTTLSVPTTGTTSYVWTPGGTGSFVSVTSPGTYSITVTDTATGCSASSSAVVTQNITAPSAVINASNGLTICNGNNTVLSVPTTGTTSYVWTPGGTSSSITATTSGTYSVTVIDGANGCFDSSSVIVMVNPLPVGNPGYQVICNGNPANVNLTSSVSGCSYTWTSTVTTGTVIGNGSCNSGCGTTITDILTNSGTVHGVVQYVITPTSPYGCVGSSYIDSVRVGATPATPGAISGPIDICTLTSTIYSVTAVPEATTYAWTVPSPMAITSGQGTSTIHVSIPAGTVTGNVTVHASNNCGTSGVSMISVTKKPSKPGSITGPSSVCSQTTASYSVSPVSGATSYLWTVPSGLTVSSGAGTSAINVNIAPTFVSGNITIASVNACGTVAGDTAKLVTGHAPLAPASIAGPTAVCGLSTINYTCAGSAGATGYTWTAPAGMSIASGQGTSAVTVSNPGGFTTGSITVAATNACGTGTARALVLNITATAPGAISGPNVVCGLTTATYSVTPVNGSTGYSWTLPANMTGSSATNSITVAIASGFTSGTVKVTSTNGCSTSAAAQMAVARVEPAPGVITASNSPCGNTSETYSIAAVAGATSYVWAIVQTPAIMTGTSATTSITVHQPGTTMNAATVKVAAVNACGTGAASSYAVAACASPIGMNNTVVDAATNNYSEIYPNPTTQEFNIDVTTDVDKTVTVEVYDVLGNIVVRESHAITSGIVNTMKTNIETFKNGMYFVRLSDENGNVVNTQRVVKQ